MLCQHQEDFNEVETELMHTEQNNKPLSNTKQQRLHRKQLKMLRIYESENDVRRANVFYFVLLC